MIPNVLALHEGNGVGAVGAAGATVDDEWSKGERKGSQSSKREEKESDAYEKTVKNLGGWALGLRYLSMVSASETSNGSPSTSGSMNIFSTTWRREWQKSNTGTYAQTCTEVSTAPHTLSLTTMEYLHERLPKPIADLSVIMPIFSVNSQLPSGMRLKGG